MALSDLAPAARLGARGLLICLLALASGCSLFGPPPLPRTYERLSVAAAPRLAKVESRWITNHRFLEVSLYLELPGVKESDALEVSLDDFEFRFEHASFDGISYSCSWSEGQVHIAAQLHFDPRDNQPAHPGRLMDFEADVEITVLDDQVRHVVTEWPAQSGKRQAFDAAPGVFVECVEWSPRAGRFRVEAPFPERIEATVTNAQGEGVSSSGRTLLVGPTLGEWRYEFELEQQCPPDARIELSYTRRALRFSGSLSATAVPVVDAEW